MIEIRSAEEIENIRRAGKILRKVIDALCNKAVPGENTLKLAEIAEELITGEGGYPAFKGYRGYPSAICTSLNSSVVHEIPSGKTVLKEGDILSVDVGAQVNGYFADRAVTIAIGNISKEAQKLVAATSAALDEGISKATAGNRVSDISHAVQVYAEASGFSVVRQFVGHGIGRALHEEPEIPNFGPPHKGARLKAGMILAIEPMVNAGSYGIDILEDGWTAVTKDGSLSAHFEHTVCVKDDKAEILT